MLLRYQRLLKDFPSLPRANRLLPREFCAQGCASLHRRNVMQRNGMQEDLGLLNYIDAVKDSANRSRFVLTVLAIASLLVFAATWNTRPDNLVYLRLQAATEAHKWCRLPMIGLRAQHGHS